MNQVKPVKQKKALTLGYCPIGHSRSPFDLLFDRSVNLAQKGLDGVDVAIFWGGTDIHPSIYGKTAHPWSQAPKNGLSDRDIFEVKMMQACRVRNIPMIGVCRGAQLMCAVAGGTLVQHVNGHSGDHAIEVDLGDGETKIVYTTSAHHQMMNPEGTEHQVLGVTFGPAHRSQFYQGESQADSVKSMYDKPEPEIIYFPRMKGLAIQGHPEWVNDSDPFAIVCNMLVEQYLLEDETIEAATE